MDKKKLKSIMILHGDTQSSLANKLGISYQRFSAKINENKNAEFTQSEINTIIKEYNLTAEETANIFFNKKVS